MEAAILSVLYGVEILILQVSKVNVLFMQNSSFMMLKKSQLAAGPFPIKPPSPGTSSLLTSDSLTL